MFAAAWASECARDDEAKHTILLLLIVEEENESEVLFNVFRLPLLVPVVTE